MTVAAIYFMIRSTESYVIITRKEKFSSDFTLLSRLSLLGLGS